MRLEEVETQVSTMWAGIVILNAYLLIHREGVAYPLPWRPCLEVRVPRGFFLLGLENTSLQGLPKKKRRLYKDEVNFWTAKGE